MYSYYILDIKLIAVALVHLLRNEVARLRNLDRSCHYCSQASRYLPSPASYVWDGISCSFWRVRATQGRLNLLALGLSLLLGSQRRGNSLPRSQNSPQLAIRYVSLSDTEMTYLLLHTFLEYDVYMYFYLRTPTGRAVYI